MVHNAIQRKKGGTPDGKDTSSVKEDYLYEAGKKKVKKSEKFDVMPPGKKNKITIGAKEGGSPNGGIINAHTELQGTVIVETGYSKFLKMVKGEKEKLNPAKVDMDGPQVGCDDPDPRSMKTASNLVKTKLRLMGLRPLMMSNEPEGNQLQEEPGDGYLGPAKLKIKNPLASDATRASADQKRKQQAAAAVNSGQPPTLGGSGSYANQFDAMRSSLKQSYEPEGEMVDEARAIGRTRSTDANPRGAAVRVSSGRGSTMTPARGLGASKPKGDDEERSNRQKEQAKKDRRAAARDRAEEGEDRLSRLVRSVQNSSYEPEGEVLEDYVVVNKDGSRKIVKGDQPTPKVKPSPYNRALAKKQKKEASRNRDENPYRARPGESD